MMTTTIKSISQVCREYPEKSRLIHAVVSRIGKDSIEDVINHGADSGFSGFIYYTDTVKFYRKYREDINHWIKESWKDIGYKSALDMVKNFGCAKDEEEDVIGFVLYGGPLNDDTMMIENCLVWFALEEVCRLFEN
jgi:hypothetical protein